MDATITSKGQVTIPKKVRDALRLRTGDRLDFMIEADGTLRIAPVTSSIRELRGIVPKPTKRLTLEEMEQAIAGGMAKQK